MMLKNIFFSLVGITFFASCGSMKSSSDKYTTAEIKTEILCDHCLQCESCYTNIYYTVKQETDGVRKVKVNPETNTISVKYKVEKTTLEEIEKAITLAGFKANEHPPQEKAYQKLDGCCRGGSY
jgi:copper chaperone CopZ